MSVTTAKFTLEQYERMVDSGAFDAPYPRHIELLSGELVEMSTIGFRHANAVTHLVEWSMTCVDLNAVKVSSQNPIRIPRGDSEPEPDVVWVKRKVYTNHPEPDDILLLIEVAESSLEIDRVYKLALYAEARIPEYWVVNLVDSCVEVYRKPQGKRYADRKTFLATQPGPSPLALPTVALDTASLF
jgi:Uma2 family endonuclease